MTKEEALKILSLKSSDLPYDNQNDKLFDAILIATSSIIKQIPKKPLIKNPSAASPTMIFKCPVCKCELDETAPNSYCPDCGQAIDWSEN